MKKWLLGVCVCILAIFVVPTIVADVPVGFHVEAASKVKINKKSVTIVKGGTVQLSVSGTSKKVEWYTSDKRIATVSSKGKVKGIKGGKVTITAKVDKKRYTCKVTVESPYISKSSISLKVGETTTLKVNGTRQKVAWSSSSKTIATVSSKGVVKGRKAGTATISAKIGNKKYKCKVTVKKAATPDKSKVPMNKYTANFDDIVNYVKKNGDFSRYGAYLTYGYVSVSMDGKNIEIYEGHDRRGHRVTLTRGSYIAEARVNLVLGYANAKFDIRYFKGDASDNLNWDNDPSQANAYTYDAAIAQILKNVANYNFYINDHSFRDIGFDSYIF